MHPAMQRRRRQLLTRRGHRRGSQRRGLMLAFLVVFGFFGVLVGGTVLGANPHQRYPEGSVAFRPGDLLLLYTDGIIEQTNAVGEPYGEERLVAFLQANRILPPDRLQNALLQDVLEFGAGRQDDDITSVIAVRRSA